MIAAPPEPAFSGLARGAAVSVMLNNDNDALGYVMPAPQWDTDEPFAYDADGQYGEQSSLGPRTAPAMVDALRALASLVAPPR